MAISDDGIPVPFVAHYFALELDGIEVAHFMEFSGLKTSTTVFEIEEGGLNGRTHKRPGQSKWDNIILRYATSASTHILDWRSDYLQDVFSERVGYTATLKMIDSESNSAEPTILRTFTFSNAWPVSWEGPSLKSDSSALALEAVEIAFDDVVVE